ncbi:phospholipase D-like domain-containing protein [Pelagibacterium montanilacus]|uniref:phospholipase D-like domain-containing protein n=1 Tax=Pelagibacterium montanilacus TaxID=2185280 RepID=UPI000F8E830D|nr:phospholipase D-like domain-containing protein [Pelagibacterium montanilacus]
MARIFSSRIFVGLAAFLLGAIVVQLLNSFVPPPHELKGPVPPRMTAGSAEFARAMDGLFPPNIVPGNAITTLVNGDEIFEAMLEEIESAQASINFETYVYWSGEIAERFAEALANRAQQGVEVRVLLDWQGSVPMEPGLVDAMTSAGVKVERFRPLQWYTVDRINNRTHRKILMVDGEVAFTGGVGIADEWRGDASGPAEWRDTHYRITGPIVAQFQGAFQDNWIETSGELLEGEQFFPPLEQAGDVPAQLLNSSVGERNLTHLMVMTALSAAQDVIRIGTPYFVPDEIAIGQLLDARERGAEVFVLMPGEHMNKELVQSASRHSWGRLLEAGVRLFEFDPTMYHAKVIIVDEAWVSVGSANFDERSFRLNDEANLNVFDPRFAAGQIALFDEDVSRAREVSLSEWENRPWQEKVTDWLWSHFRVQL